MENLQKTFFLLEKIQLQVSKSGVFGEKMFRKTFETSLVIRSKKDNLPYLAVWREKKIYRKIFQLSVSKMWEF